MEGFDAATGQAPQGQQPQGQQPADPFAGAELSKEQQATIKKFVVMGTELLVNEKFMSQAQGFLEAQSSVEEGMAQIAVSIASRIYLQSVEEGTPIPLELVVFGGALLMQEVAEFAQASGKEVGPESVEDAFYRASDLFRELLMNKGLITQEDLQGGYEELRKQYGDDTFEVIGERVQGVKQAGAPQAAPQAAPQQQQQMGAGQ